MATHEAVQTMLAAFNDYLLERETGTEAPFLFPDEIADIIRSAPDGATLEIWDYPDVRESFRIRHDGNTITLRSGSGRTVPAADIVGTIYDELESGGYITIDGKNILTM